MPFPNSPRVIYRKNPLEQVICQIRFPSILRIDTEIPAAFQELVRSQFPLFEERQEGGIEIPVELSEQLPREILRLPGIGKLDRKSYQFSTLDEQWTITLTRDFMALATNQYQRWEEFQSNFKLAFEALLKEYTPVLFSRIGLRYLDVIRRSTLGLEDRPWPELLQPHIAGVLATHDFDSEHILNTTQVIEMTLSNDYGRATIRHGFAIDKATGETCYLIDNDFFAEKIKDSNDVNDRLTQFNLRARRLFRWCITDKLHEAMEPQAIN